MRKEEAKLNAPVYVDHLDEERPDLSLESNNAERLRDRQAQTTGILRTWVAGQVGHSIWVQMDNTGRLVPYNLSELILCEYSAAAQARGDHHFVGTGERCGHCSLSYDQGAHFIKVKQPA